MRAQLCSLCAVGTTPSMLLPAIQGKGERPPAPAPARPRGCAPLPPRAPSSCECSRPTAPMALEWAGAMHSALTSSGHHSFYDISFSWVRMLNSAARKKRERAVREPSTEEKGRLLFFLRTHLGHFWRDGAQVKPLLGLPRGVGCVDNIAHVGVAIAHAQGLAECAGRGRRLHLARRPREVLCIDRGNGRTGV